MDVQNSLSASMAPIVDGANMGGGSTSPAAPVAVAASMASSPAVPGTPASVTPVTAAPDARQVKDAVAKINDTLRASSASQLEFSVDSNTHENVVKVIDTQTKDVIRQFPSKEALAIAQALDTIQGLLIHDKA